MLSPNELAQGANTPGLQLLNNLNTTAGSTLLCVLYEGQTPGPWQGKATKLSYPLATQASNARDAACTMLSASTAKKRRSAARVSLRPKPSVPSVV
jgi:hypothetical protein